MTSRFVAQDDNTFLTIADSSKSWVVLRDGTSWVSTDRGKIGMKAYTLDPAQQTKKKANLKQRADEATNLFRTEGVEFECGTFHQSSKILLLIYRNPRFFWGFSRQIDP